MGKTYPIAVQAVVIDLDGTLLNTAPDLADAANRMLAEMRRPLVPIEVTPIAAAASATSSEVAKILLRGL